MIISNIDTLKISILLPEWRYNGSIKENLRITMEKIVQKRELVVAFPSPRETAGGEEGGHGTREVQKYG